MTESSATDRVIYIGAGRRLKRRWFGRPGLAGPECEWRQCLAQEMEDACQEMSRRGLRLVQIVPVISAGAMRGSWTEGAWLYFSQPLASGTELRFRDHQYAF